MYVLINYLQEREYHNLESGNTFVHLKSLCLFQELFFYDFCRNIIVKVELSANITFLDVYFLMYSL